MIAFFAGLLPVKCNFTPYPSGLYRTSAGAEYKLSQGPSALSVVGPDGLCLLFWDQEDPQRVRKVIELRGQRCMGGRVGELDWTARYVAARLDEVQLTSSAAGSQPLNLVAKNAADRP
jgi:hypothetical protein